MLSTNTKRDLKYIVGINNAVSIMNTKSIYVKDFVSQIRDTNLRSDFIERINEYAGSNDAINSFYDGDVLINLLVKILYTI